MQGGSEAPFLLLDYSGASVLRDSERNALPDRPPVVDSERESAFACEAISSSFPKRSLP
jgi:hypothetical protein